VNVLKIMERMPRLSLYRVRDQSMYKEEGSPNREVVSLREGLDNLACKLHCLVKYVWTWLSLWSCAHVAVRCGVVLLCRSWRHYRHDGGSPVVLCDVVSVMAFVIASCLLGHCTRVGSRPQIIDHPVSLVELVAMIPGSRVVAPVGLDGL
jgi:hypothetical protein